MTNLVCKRCQNHWDAERQPICPKCEANSLNNIPDIVPLKHDPRQLPSAYPRFRSVVSEQIVNNLANNLQFAAYSGTALYSNPHSKFCKIVTMPSGINAGSAIPSGNMMPTSGLDSLVIADSYGKPHIYAESESEILSKIKLGKLQVLPKCSVTECNNLCVPYDNKCAYHTTPSLGDIS